MVLPACSLHARSSGSTESAPGETMLDERRWRQDVVKKKRGEKKKRSNPGVRIATHAATRDDPHLAALRDLVARRRENARGKLEAETNTLLKSGAQVRDVLWVLLSDQANARLIADVIAETEKDAPELAAQIRAYTEACPPGHVSLMYIGPEPARVGAGVIFECVQVFIVHDEAGTHLSAPSVAKQAPQGEIVAARYDDTKRYYWVAINGAAIPAWLSTPMPMPTVTPVPEMLLGFVDQVEARSVQRLLLTASHEECAQQFRVLAARADVAFAKFRAPEKPDPNKETIWSFPNPRHT